MLSGIERSNYIEFGPKKLSGIRNREVFRVFYHIKNRREQFGTDQIVRFHGDSGIERFRFRGFFTVYDMVSNSNNIHPLSSTSAQGITSTEIPKTSQGGPSAANDELDGRRTSQRSPFQNLGNTKTYKVCCC